MEHIAEVTPVVIIQPNTVLLLIFKIIKHMKQSFTLCVPRRSLGTRKGEEKLKGEV